MYRLKEKVALITLDRCKLAEAVAVAFGREGAIVIIADAEEKRLMSVARIVRGMGVECMPIIMDPVNQASCERGIATIMEEHGQLDILCNLAGEFPLTGPMHEIQEDEFDRAVQTNIKSVLLASRFAVPAIRQSSGVGSIINLSHSAVLNSVPGTSLLAATKGALINMTRDMAMRGQKEGFRANCVCVGSTFAPAVPSLMNEHTQNRVSAEELAPTFVYLASDDSQHVQGHILTVDDGMNAWRDDSQRARIAEMEASTAPSASREEASDATNGYLDGQVAIITAGGGGIACATARLFAREGAKIVLSDINREAAESVATEVCSAGGEASVIAADILAGDDCARVVRETIKQYGRLDILINLVGFFGKGGGTVDRLSLEEWDWMMDMNLKSVFLMSKYAIPEMLRAGRGAIVNTGTIAAVIGRGGLCYGTGKSGVLSLTRAMAADYFKSGIRVNAVCPSGTDTGMFYDCVLANRVQRGVPIEQAKESVRRGDQGLSKPEEIAPSFLFLASDQLSRKINGHILMTDNGFAVMRL